MLKSFKYIKKFGELAYAVNSLWNDYDYCLWKYLEILVLWNIEISLEGNGCNYISVLLLSTSISTPLYHIFVIKLIISNNNIFIGSYEISILFSKIEYIIKVHGETWIIKTIYYIRSRGKSIFVNFFFFFKKISSIFSTLFFFKIRNQIYYQCNVRYNIIITRYWNKLKTRFPWPTFTNERTRTLSEVNEILKWINMKDFQQWCLVSFKLTINVKSSKMWKSHRII